MKCGKATIGTFRPVKTLLNRIHARIGDFWWYSLMIFMAARAADCLNVFVGLWLVPKYVPPSELGAVMPLTQFASFLAMPAAVFASTFRNELTGLATRREFGKMKTLMRSVFIATAVFFFLAIVISRILMPHFLLRIRLVEGSLGMIVLVTSFLGTVAPVYANALQSLKKFKETSVINLLCAPIRFITMIVMMPFRAISGYFVGQSSTPAFSILTSIFVLRKELKVKAEPYWTKPTAKRFATVFMLFLSSGLVCAWSSLVDSTVLRQRLPELDSAAYYMVTRFSDIAGFLFSAVNLTLFPFIAESSNLKALSLQIKTAIAVLLSNAILALFFTFTGRVILSILPNGAQYANFWWAIPWIIAIATLTQLCQIYITAENAKSRFNYMKWLMPLHLGYAVLLLSVTGYGYFELYLPSAILKLIKCINITSLSDILWWFTAFNGVKLLICIYCRITMHGREPVK